MPRSSIPPNCTRSDPFIINLGWSMPKINATQLANLGRIVAGTTCFVQFRFFVGEPYISEFTILKSALEFVPADRMIFTPRVQSHDYLSWFQRGHLMLDSHHHGSCNTAVDALVTHTPSVLYEGVRWNNRIAPAMFRRAGMAEHIATNDDELVTKTLQLVNNATYWSATVQRLAALDLDSLFFSKRTDDADMYAAAFMYLHAHHERIQQSSTSVGDDGVTPLRLGPPPVLRLKVVTDPVTHAMTASLLATS